MFAAAPQNPLLGDRDCEHYFPLEAKHQACETPMLLKGNWRADLWLVAFTPQVAKEPME
jgi:hypothetical protein